MNVMKNSLSDKTTTIADLRKHIQAFRSKRGWIKEDPKDLALSLILEASELLEHFQWLTGDEVATNAKIKEAISEEMSDVLWWLINLGTRLNIDIASAFERKLAKNAIKYPEKLFSPKMTEKEQTREYYKIKAATRGGHPLYEPEKAKPENSEKK